MRLILELAVVAALIAFGWNKSFSERAGLAAAPQMTARAEPALAPGTPLAHPTAIATATPQA